MATAQQRRPAPLLTASRLGAESHAARPTWPMSAWRVAFTAAAMLLVLFVGWRRASPDAPAPPVQAAATFTSIRGRAADDPPYAPDSRESASGVVEAGAGAQGSLRSGRSPRALQAAPSLTPAQSASQQRLADVIAMRNGELATFFIELDTLLARSPGLAAAIAVRRAAAQWERDAYVALLTALWRADAAGEILGLAETTGAVFGASIADPAAVPTTTPTPSNTPSHSPTPSTTPSGTSTGTATGTSSATATATATSTATATGTATSTSTRTATPTPSTSRSASGTPTPSAAPTPGFSVVESCVVPGTIAVTFDDGPGTATQQLVNTFNAAGAKMTLFVNGQNFDCIHNSAAAMQSAVAGGHQIGSHTWAHLDLITLTTANVQYQMNRLDYALQLIIGKAPLYMRPPFGSSNAAVEATLRQMGYKTAVIWNLDSLDYTHTDNMTASKELYKTDGVKTANIISLQHDVWPNTVTDLAPWIIAWAKARNLKMVTVGECLGDTNPANWYRQVAVPATVGANCNA